MFNKYFQEELAYLRELGHEFSEAYPLLAPMLAERGADPDVERLLEGVAFLTGRIRQKLDDEVPEVIHAICALLFPQLLRPLPGATIMELTPFLGSVQAPVVVKAGTEFASREVEGVACRFRSSVDCTIAPLLIEDARLDSLPGGRQQLRVALRAQTSDPSTAIPQRTRFHFSGDVRAALDLLQWVHDHTVDVLVAEPQADGRRERELSLGRSALHLVGFEEDETLYPESDTILPGLRLLLEYFALPQKFAFVDVEGLDRSRDFASGGRLDVLFRFDKPFPHSAEVDKQWIKLHCVPAVNVFPTTAEPIRVVQTRERYLVRPAGLQPEHGDVYAIRQVETMIRADGTRRPVPPYLSFARSRENPIFYATHLLPSAGRDGANTWIAFGTHTDGGIFPEVDVISLELWATNRALASALRPGEISLPAIGSPQLATFKNLYAVTPYVPVPLGSELHWRMIAHASMGLRSLATRDVLRAMFDVYNLVALVDRRAARAGELRKGALKDVRVTPAERLHRGSIVRGVEIGVDVEGGGFLGDGDLFLMSAVLDRLFASYVSINSFSRTVVTDVESNQRHAWPARIGNLTLL